MGKVTSENLPHLLYPPPILLDDALDDMICLVNNHSMFTLYTGNVEELWFWSLLEGTIKDSIKFLH